MAELLWNPETRLILRRRGGDVTAVTAAAPVRGRPLQIITFHREKAPAIVELLLRIAARKGAVDVDLDDAEWARLADVGLVVPDDQVPIVPRFQCSPRDPPLSLLPRRPAPPAGPRLHVNPTLRYQDEERSPEEGWEPRQTVIVRARKKVNPFTDRAAWAWVEHADVPLPSALSIDEPDREAFRRLRPGEPEPQGVDRELRGALVRTGVLIDLADTKRRRKAWARVRKDAGLALQRDGYVVVRGLLHPAPIAALRRYYRELIAEGHMRLGSRQVSRRYWAHNEPLARFFHRRLADLVSDIAGEPMKPSFTYFASYLAGSVLKPHRDRDQCAISVSLLLDAVPEPEEVSSWPIWIGLDGRRRRAAQIDLGLGDGLFFRGTELYHWRHALPEGHSSSSMLFHFVPAAFTGSLL